MFCFSFEIYQYTCIILFRSVPLSIVTHTGIYKQRNGTEQETLYIETLQSLENDCFIHLYLFCVIFRHFPIHKGRANLEDENDAISLPMLIIELEMTRVDRDKGFTNGYIE